MSRPAPARSVVKFAVAVDAPARDDLLAALLDVQLTARTGLDIGERGPLIDHFPVRAVITLLGDAAAGAGKITQAATAARQWLIDRADPGYTEIEVKASDAVVRVRAADPETAVQHLAEALAGLTAAAPIGWHAGRWVEENEEEDEEPEGPHRAGGSRKPRVLLLDTHWFSAKGGISTFNRALAAALAGAGADVVSVALAPSTREVESAAGRQVRLVGAQPVPTGSAARDALLRPPLLPAGWEPEIVVGHGHITGPYARMVCADHFPSAARAHIVHTWSDHIEWQRHDTTAAGKTAEHRWAQDVELARTAECAFAVGPLLHLQLKKSMSRPGDPHPVRIDPGFDLADDHVRRPPGLSERTVMVMGRLDDWRVKGLDIAAKIAGRAAQQLGSVAEVELLLRGVPEGEHSAVRERVLSWASDPHLQVTPRSFSESPQDLRDDLYRSSLLLMTARAEGFGLVGLEAIVAGTPLLVSARSGLGMLLKEHVPTDAERLVLPVRDEEIDRWASFAVGMLRDEAGAFAAAERVRRLMAERVTNAAVARVVLGAFGH